MTERRSPRGGEAGSGEVDPDLARHRALVRRIVEPVSDADKEDAVPALIEEFDALIESAIPPSARRSAHDVKQEVWKRLACGERPGLRLWN